MRNYITDLEKDIKNGKEITFDQAMKLANLENSIEIEQLCNSANNIKSYFCGDKVELCAIINAKSGNCSEDCKFCAQSSHYKTGAKVSTLVSKEVALKAGKENEEEDVNRFSLVTSGRKVNGKDFDRVLEIYDSLNKELKIKLCASFGILNYQELVMLKEKGVTRYHHNLETSREYFQKICTTHSYDERIDTINSAIKAGMEVCCGGIIGLGEEIEDRVKLAFQIKKLGARSIPINILNPIKGTPLENAKGLSQNEILKAIAVFRFINPKALIRLAGGRNLIDDYGKRCLSSGANATITGNFLTTSGNTIIDVKKMINELSFKK